MNELKYKDDGSVDFGGPEPVLPDDIKECFQPFETIGPMDNRYMAQPRFVPYPDNHLRGWVFTFERTSADGSKWLVRQYSPSKGYFDVIFCRATDTD